MLFGEELREIAFEIIVEKRCPVWFIGEVFDP